MRACLHADPFIFTPSLTLLGCLFGGGLLELPVHVVMCTSAQWIRRFWPRPGPRIQPGKGGTHRRTMPHHSQHPSRSHSRGKQIVPKAFHQTQKSRPRLISIFDVFSRFAHEYFMTLRKNRVEKRCQTEKKNCRVPFVETLTDSEIRILVRPTIQSVI